MSVAMCKVVYGSVLCDIAYSYKQYMDMLYNKYDVYIKQYKATIGISPSYVCIPKHDVYVDVIVEQERMSDYITLNFIYVKEVV